MPFIKVMIHLIWSTKNRRPLISKVLKPVLLSHLKNNSIKKGIFIDSLNCVEDHIHLLISLSIGQTIDKVAMLLKGESSFWVNQQRIIKEKFEWQDEYIALSVSQSAVPKVRAYISNQGEHHKMRTFAEEYDALLLDYGFEKNKFG